MARYRNEIERRENLKYQKTRIKHGKTIADIDKAINNEKVNKVKAFATEYASLLQTSDGKFKEIQKIGALSSMAISTTQAVLLIAPFFCLPLNFP